MKSVSTSNISTMNVMSEIIFVRFGLVNIAGITDVSRF